jgi:orotate phosphoribosyltransferase-like protein
MKGNRPSWNKIDPALIHKMRSMKESGITCREIGDRLDVSFSTVARWLRHKV